MLKIGPLKEWMIEQGAEIQFPKYGFWFIKLYWELEEEWYSIELIITTDSWDITINKADFSYSQYKVFDIHDVDAFIADLEDQVRLEILLGTGNCVVHKYSIEGEKVAEIGGHWKGPKDPYRSASKYYGLKEFLEVKERNGDKYSGSNSSSNKKKYPKSKSKAKRKY